MINWKIILNCDTFILYMHIWCTFYHTYFTLFVQGVASGEGCEDSLQSRCKSLTTCPLCRDHHHCDWVENLCVAAPNRTSATGDVEEAGPNLTLEDIPSTHPVDQPDHQSPVTGGIRNALHPLRKCEPTCAERSSCSNCTATKVMIGYYCSKALFREISKVAELRVRR